MHYQVLIEEPYRAVLSLKTAPAQEPVDIPGFAAHARLDIPQEDQNYIENLLKAARQDIELLTQRQLVTATYELFLDAWPACDYLELPRPPLQSVTSIEYKNAAGIFVAFATSGKWEYTTYTATDPGAPRGRIRLLPYITWPTMDWLGAGGIRVTFIAGYGAAAAVPSLAKHAIYEQAAELYERREAAITGTIISPVSLTAERLIAALRVY